MVTKLNKEEILKTILEKPKKLSPAQEKAVISQKDYLRIVAGAGAGKTETMTRRIAFLLLYKNIEPKAIVAFTFTERAAQSIKDRIYRTVKELHGDDACAMLGKMYIGTIHAYCFRILQDFFGYSDYEVLDDNQEMAFVMREGWSFGLGKGSYSKNCEAFIRSVNVVYDELLNIDLIEKKDESFSRHLKDYEEILKKHKLITFGQLISHSVEKLKENPEVLANIKYLIVDEYQDINRAQERLIQVIGKNASVFVVGDPRQSIYQWRGSDEKCFDSFLKKFSNSESIDIRENRRSGKVIVQLANKFAADFRSTRYEPMLGTRNEEGIATLLRCYSNVSEAEWIIKQVKKVVEQIGLCNYSDIAILLRSVSTSAGPFIDILKRENVPYLVGGKVGLFRRDEAQAFGRLFTWFGDNFWVEDSYNWSKRTEGKNLLDSAIDCWKASIKIKSTPPNLYKNLENIKNNIHLGKYKCFTSIYQDLLIILKFLDLDPDNKSQAAIMANLGRFNELLTDYESSIRRGGVKPDWIYDLRGLCWYMNSYATGAYEEQPAEDLRGTDALQIMTVHQAKGLEWPVVFVPCVVHKRFPSSMAGSKREWYIPESLFDVKRYQGGEEDEKRLFYVAITRAMDVLTISRFEQMYNLRSPSIFWNTLKNLLSENDEKFTLFLKKIDKPKDVDEIQSYSAGEILSYFRCPYLYRLREMWGYQPELVLELGYGKSLHYCLHLASNKLKQGKGLQKAISEAIEDKFHLPFANNIKKKKLREEAERKLLEFAMKYREDMMNIEETESRLEFPMENATITGRVDVIIKNKPNILEVRDYKTSDTVTTGTESALQLRLYTLGLKSIGRPIQQASIAYLENSKVEKISVEEKELDNAKTAAKKCIGRIKSSYFKGKKGEQCKRCDYTRICRFYNI